MKEISESTIKKAPPMSSSMEEAINEALFVAEFFDLVPPDANGPNGHLPTLPLDSPLAEYLETAQEQINSPIGIDELGALTILGQKRG